MRGMKYVLVALVGLLLAGCSDAPLATIPGADRIGELSITINVERVGVLAKASSMQMGRLVVTLSAADEAVIIKEFPLSTYGGEKVLAAFDSLASFKHWKISAETYDRTGKMIHRGTATVYVEPRVIATASLVLKSEFSILEIAFTKIPDSVTQCQLVIDAQEKDSELMTQSIILSHDYVSVNESHTVEVHCYGRMWGDEMELYSGFAEVKPVSGEDQKYSMFLKWVGADKPPRGAAEIIVEVGSIGRSTVQTNFEDHVIKYKTEKK